MARQLLSARDVKVLVRESKSTVRAGHSVMFMALDFITCAVEEYFAAHTEFINTRGCAHDRYLAAITALKECGIKVGA